MAASIAAELLEMNGAIHPPPTILLDGVARLVRALGDTKLTAAELNHLGHERQRIEFTALIESRQDLVGASDFDQLAGAEVQAFILDATRFVWIFCRRRCLRRKPESARICIWRTN